jgi:hypothetical protein
MSLFIIPVNHLYAVISNEIYFQSILFESDGQNWIRLGFKTDVSIQDCIKKTITCLYL